MFATLKLVTPVLGVVYHTALLMSSYTQAVKLCDPKGLKWPHMDVHPHVNHLPGLICQVGGRVLVCMHVEWPTVLRSGMCLACSQSIL